MFKSTLIILLSMFAWGLLHSLTASLWAKARARQLLGPLAGRGYRLAYNLVAGVTLLPVFALAALLPDRELYAIPLNGVQYCYEAYVGTTPYVFFSLPMQTSHGDWVFNVYAVPTSFMRSLRG